MLCFGINSHTSGGITRKKTKVISEFHIPEKIEKKSVENSFLKILGVRITISNKIQIRYHAYIKLEIGIR